MTPRGGAHRPASAPPEKALANTVTRAVKDAVRPMGGFALSISVSIATDEEGRPCGSVVAVTAPTAAKVKDVIDVTPEKVPPAESSLAKKEG